MNLAKRQISIISLLLSLGLLIAPLAQELNAQPLFSKIKEKASSLVSTNVNKYTSRDFWVDKTASTITTKVIAKPVKLAASALGAAVGTALGGSVGAALGGYVGGKIGSHLCSIVGKPIVKGVINDKLDNGGLVTPSTIFKVCKNLDMPSLACDTTGAVIGDILGSAIGGMAGAAVIACVGGGTILPIIGTITFATLGSKYGQKLGTWLGKKIGENSFNRTYKALTGVDRTKDGRGDQNVILATIDDIKAVDKEKLAKKTTAEITGDVIGSVVGAVAGATITACCGGGALTPVFGSTNLSSLGSKYGSQLGTRVGRWLGNNVFDNTQKAISGIDKKLKGTKKDSKGSNITIENTQIAVSDSMPIGIHKSINSTEAGKISDADAAFLAYQIAYDNYADVLSDPKATDKIRAQRQKEYNACYEQYQRVINQTIKP